MVKIKRAYELPESGDGRRILVDRLWPRGLSKDTAKIDEWLKEVAPSSELRTWFGHDPGKWDEFRKRYVAELARNDLVPRLKREAQRETVTLLFAAKDTEHNNAVVLKELMES